MNTPEIIIDSSGKGRKVWKSEIIGPVVIVDTGGGPHVGSFRVDGMGSKQTNYTKICFIQKPNNTIRVLIGLCKFWGPWAHRVIVSTVFSAANLALAGFPQTNALGENLPSRHLNMLNLHLCNAATIRYSLLKFRHMHLCDKDYKYFSPLCSKCNSFGCIAAIRCGSACYGPHSDSFYSGSKRR